MRVFIAVMLLALAASPLARAADPIARIPYRLDYAGWITIDVTIEGRGPYTFIIDTGSTITLAFQNLADELAFSPTGRPPIRVLGISSQNYLDTYEMGDVGIGTAKLEEHIGVVLPDWEDRETPHGIIGLDFLEKYAVYFDESEQTMTLYPHGGIPEELTDPLSRIELRATNYGAVSGALYTTRGRINRTRTNFIIDLGSVSSLINYEAAEAIYSSVLTRDLGEGFTTGSRLKDVFEDRSRARTARINKIQLGRVNWRNHGVWVYDAPVFDEINVQRLPYALAGVDLLSDRDFALDFGEKNMFIARRPSSR